MTLCVVSVAKQGWIVPLDVDSVGAFCANMYENIIEDNEYDEET